MQHGATSAGVDRPRVLGRHLRQARARVFGPQTTAAQQIDVVRTTLNRLETGSGGAKAETWAKVEDALGWPAGSAEAYLRGAAPLPSADGAQVEAPVSGLDDDVEQLLVRRGAVTTSQRVAALQAIVMDVIESGPHPDA